MEVSPPGSPTLYPADRERILVEIGRKYIGRPIRDPAGKLYVWVLMFGLRRNGPQGQTQSCGDVTVRQPYDNMARGSMEVECHGMLPEEEAGVINYFKNTFSLTNSAIIKLDPLLPMLLYI